MTPAPTERARELRVVTRNDPETPHCWPIDKVMVAGPDAQWQDHRPLRNALLWEQFAKRDASRTVIKNLCQRYGFLTRQDKYLRLLDVSAPLVYKDSQAHFSEFAVDNTIVPDFADSCRDVPPFSYYIDESIVFLETEGMWRYEMHKLAVAALIYGYLQTGQSDENRGPAISPDPWIWQAQHYQDPRDREMRWEEERAEILWNELIPPEIDPDSEPWANDSMEIQQRLNLCLNHLLSVNIRKMSLKIVNMPDMHYPEIKLTPPNLLTGLWVQLSLYVNSARYIKLCRWCGQPFVGRSAGGRSCSSRCTQRQARKRKKGRGGVVTTVSQRP